MFDAYEALAERGTIENLAEALRQELQEEIDAYPAFRDPAEAGQVNRGFRAAARRLLQAAVPPGEELAGLLTWALIRIARRRLRAGGLSRHQTELVLNLESPGRDDWSAFLILAPWPEVLDLLDPEGPSGR